MKKKSLLLTGATGYLGTSLLKELDTRDIFDRVIATHHSQQLCEYSSIYLEFVPYSTVLEYNYKLDDFYIICHLGVPRVNASDPALAQSVVDFRKLVHKAADAGVSGLVFASSQAVYGVTPPMWAETTPPAPVTSHGWGKFANEQVLSAVAECHPDFGVLSLRLPKLIGPGVGFREDQGELIHKLALHAACSERVLVNQNFLAQSFDFLDVRDAASVLADILAMPPSSWPTVLNVGAGQALRGDTMLQMVSNCSQNIYGRPLEWEIQKEGPALRNFGMNADALRNYLGDLATRPMTSTIEDVFGWLLDGRHKR